jgi:hypothetical protein
MEALSISLVQAMDLTSLISGIDECLHLDKIRRSNRICYPHGMNNTEAQVDTGYAIDTMHPIPRKVMSFNIQERNATKSVLQRSKFAGE